MGLFYLYPMDNWKDMLQSIPEVIIAIIVGMLAGLILIWLIHWSVNLMIKKGRAQNLLYFKKRCKKAVSFLLPVAFVFIALHIANSPTWLLILFRTLLILAVSFLLIRLTFVVQDIMLDKYDITKKEDNRHERKILTQLNFIKNAVILAIIIITISALLLSFDGGQKFGAGLLTSAGVASVIIGFAAQKTIANFLAGIQIAFTQPMKIDDAVLVEKEWGWIEEINLTYVVVRLWDWRRLILPITYFVNEPFQNWTRNKAEIIGSVFFHLDYSAPVDKIRGQLTKILENEPLWDKKVNVLHVVDATEKTIQLRALMSAKTSPQAWDLRCSVREKLITYVRENHPECLPLHRIKTQT